MDPNQEPRPPRPDGPDQEETERIRRRRVAQLGSSASAPPKQDEAASTAATSPSPQPTTRDGANEKSATESRVAITVKPAAENPFSQLTTAQPASGGQADSSGRVENDRKRPAEDIDSPSATPATSRKQTPSKPPSIEDYADKMLTQIFRATPDPTQNVDRGGNKLTFLPNLHQELQEAGAPLKLSTDLLDSAILEAATAIPHNKPVFDYLLACFKRVSRAIKLLRGPAAEKEQILKEAKRICFSNCIFALSMPELFRYTCPNSLCKSLLMLPKPRTEPST